MTRDPDPDTGAVLQGLVDEAVAELIEQAALSLVTIQALDRLAEEPLRPSRTDWPEMVQPLVEGWRSAATSVVRGLAIRASENDSSAISYQQAVLCWATLEALVENLVVEAITRNPSVVDNDKTRVPISTLLLDPDEQRLEAAIALITKHRTREHGIDRFEGPLAGVGLGSGESLGADTRRAFDKLEMIRNLVAHRRGVIDSTFLKHWPGPADGLELGSRLVVEPAVIHEIARGVIDYLSTLRSRFDSDQGG